MVTDGAGVSAQQEAQRLRDYAEAAADWFWEMDEGLRFTRMAPATGLPEAYSGEEFVGRRLDEVRGLDTGADDGPALGALLEAHLPFRDARLVCVLDGGGRLYLSLSGLPVFAADGIFTGYRGIGRDLTLLRRAEEHAVIAQRELAETTALLRATFDNMEQGLVVLDQDLCVREWNHRLHEIFRHPPEELWVGRPVAELVYRTSGDDTASADARIAFLRRAAAERQPGRREFATARGTVIEMLVTPMPEGGLIATYLDVTERKRAEQVLAETSALLRGTLDSMQQGLLVLDGELRIRLWNDRLWQLFKQAPETLRVGRPVADMIYEYAGRQSSRAERSIALFESATRQRQPAVREITLPDGRSFEMRLMPMAAGGLVVTYLDVSERKRADQDLAETTSLLRGTLDNMDQGLLVLDSDMRVKLWNERLRELFGHGFEVLRAGRPYADLVGDQPGTFTDRAAVSVAFVRRAMETREPAVREFHSTSGRVVEMRLEPMPDGGAIATYLDVSRRKAVEADLRRAKEEAELASRSKSEFLANMSHELRTPLNAIIGFADILKGEIFGSLGDQRYRDYAADIRDSGTHLLKLINDVLDVSKVEFGKIELAEEPVDVISVVESCVRLMRDRVEAGELHLTHSFPAGMPLVQCDEMRLKQILLNLLSNAVKFTPPGGRITIRAALDDRGLGISVEDTGIGIAPADLDKALRPFGQIDSRLARKYQGTGLGLPLAKSMIELHGGRLELESAPGIGTKATVWMPAERILYPAEMRSSAIGES
jgi:PAS domain S-box-containing protein